MTSPKTASEFVEVLEQSQLIAPVHLGRIRAQIPQRNNPGFDAATFAKAAIKEGLITPYQAKQLMTGRPEGFFVGKYRLLDVLGQGGMGKVYLAEQMTMKRAVALKVVRLSRHDDPSVLVRFTREARAAAKLRHQNITQAFDFDQAPPYHYISMEFIEGINLQEWVEKTGPVPWALAASYVSQAARGLQHASEHGLVHRDIKPGNLMVETSGMLKILDLGLVVLPGEVDTLTRAQRNLILGTADYMSPEQAMDSHQVDIRADIYSLGAVFFFLLAGRPPFLGKSAAAKIFAHQMEQPQAIDELVPEMPKRMAEIVRRMLAKHPADRFNSPAEVADALKAFAQLATKASPPYDLSLVRFNRTQVDKLVLYGADAPPTQQQPPEPWLNGSTLDEKALASEIGTPSPTGTLTSVGNTARPATPRSGTRKKSGLTKIAAEALQPAADETPAPRTNARPSPTMPRKSGTTKLVREKSEVQAAKSESPRSETPRSEKRKARRKSIKLIWLLFATPNVLAVLYIVIWLFFLR